MGAFGFDGWGEKLGLMEREREREREKGIWLGGCWVCTGLRYRDTEEMERKRVREKEYFMLMWQHMWSLAIYVPKK